MHLYLDIYFRRQKRESTEERIECDKNPFPITF